MPTKPRPGLTDPARDHNERILADRERRMINKKAREVTPVDLGLDLKQKEPETAFEFIRDEFDRKNFGDTPHYHSRILYGPDPLLLSCPIIKERLEAIGLEEYANTTYETILLKQEMAFDDPLLRKGIKQAIKKFGPDEVAAAFKRRILAIPTRTVQIEADTGDDDEVFGKPLEDAVRRYGNPGMAPKFMSTRCIGSLGMRGYQFVKDEHGSNVTVGTLIMTEIPQQTADRRLRKAAEASNAAVREQEESYMAEAERLLRAATTLGVNLGRGNRPLASGEVIEGNASDNRAPVTMGFKTETQEEIAA